MSKYITLAVAILAAGTVAYPADAVTTPVVTTILPHLPFTSKVTPTVTKGIVLPSPIATGTKVIGKLSLSAGALIENAACDLSQNLFPGEPLHQLFNVSDFLGHIIGPKLTSTFGAAFVAEIDSTADQLCISAEQDKPDGLGFCQTALAALYDLTKHEAGPKKVAAFNCFLELACVAPTGFAHPGTCQDLLAGADCIANRLINADQPECCPKSNPTCA